MRRFQPQLSEDQGTRSLNGPLTDSQPSATPAFERPSAINERISRSRAVNVLSNEADRRHCINLAIIVGSSLVGLTLVS